RAEPFVARVLEIDPHARLGVGEHVAQLLDRKTFEGLAFARHHTGDAWWQQVFFFRGSGRAGGGRPRRLLRIPARSSAPSTSPCRAGRWDGRGPLRRSGSRAG